MLHLWFRSPSLVRKFKSYIFHLLPETLNTKTGCRQEQVNTKLSIKSKGFLDICFNISWFGGGSVGCAVVVKNAATKQRGIEIAFPSIDFVKKGISRAETAQSLYETEIEWERQISSYVHLMKTMPWNNLLQELLAFPLHLKTFCDSVEGPPCNIMKLVQRSQ